MVEPLLENEFTTELIAPVFDEVAAAVPVDVAPDRMNLMHVVDSWRSLMRAGVAETWVGRASEKVAGILGGLFVPEFFSGKPMAMEQWFFVLKDFRKSRIAVELWNAFEAEARRRGASTIWAGASRWHDPDRLGRWYERRGFIWWNKVYRKLLKQEDYIE